MPARKPSEDPAIRLAAQAPAALRALVDHAPPCLAGEPPAQIHAGLVAVVLRLVVLLHAESRGLLPPVVAPLHDRLRAEPGRHEAWPRLLACFRRTHARHRGRLFDPDAHALLGRLALPGAAVLAALDALRRLDDVVVDYSTVDLEHLGGVHEALLAVRLERAADRYTLQPAATRRATGTHYTPRGLTEPVVEAALRPLRASARAPTTIKICDLAMGSGAFLLAACRRLADELARAAAIPVAEARRRIAEECLHGVDLDPLAVELAGVSLWLLVGASDRPFDFLAARLRVGDSLVDSDAFSWRRAFPGVFAGDDPGFDCVVANPPFKGSVALGRTSPDEYTSALRRLYPGAGGKTDLVAFFLRRAFDLLRGGGTLGMIATNTVRQGDTRESGLLQVVRRGGTIYAATRDLKWPGAAAVTVSLLHIIKGRSHPGTCRLDGRDVPRISAFLLPFGPDASPAPLRHACAALLGAKPGARGFVVGGRSGISDAELDAILAVEPAARAHVRPYLTGEDLLVGPDPRPLRRVVDYHDVELADARRATPRLLARLQRELRPAADDRRWHQFARPARALRAHLAGRGRAGVLCTPETSKWHIVVRQSGELVPSNAVVVFTSDAPALFAVLQSTIHELWCREFSSTLEDRLRYVASDCFDSFAFPDDTLTHPALAAAGAAYHDARATLLKELGVGLTALYNRMHDPAERRPEVTHMRRLHADVDRAVLLAYGWGDVADVHAARDEVLARLLDRNHRRRAGGDPA